MDLAIWQQQLAQDGTLLEQVEVVVQVLEAPEPKARMRWGDRSQSNNRQTIGKIREASQARLCIISSKKNSTSMRTTILTVAGCIAAAIAARVSAIRPVTL